MVNPALFQTPRSRHVPQTDTHNSHGAAAYALTPKHQLAQLAATGCLNSTFYADAAEQLDAILILALDSEPEFVAQTAIYARERGHMKDMPALLAAVLAVRDVALLAKVFPRIIDNGKMLRNFVQILRSGTVGRKSLGTRPKKLVQQWLLSASEKQLLYASVGNTPSLADVVKMVHPKPQEPWRAAWFAWLIGKPYEAGQLPPITAAFERFKQANALGKDLSRFEQPDVPFQMLTALNLSSEEWAMIARRGSWQMVRQNLNTFVRHGVFKLPGMPRKIAAQLRDKKAIAKARVMPYQLMAAYLASVGNVPPEIGDALQDAMELALHNVPELAGNVVVCPDVSGSMGCPVTGYRKGASSKVRCIDVAALVAAAILRKNPKARVLPFEQTVVNVPLNPRDSVMTNAQKLAAIGGGGTACSAPLALLNKEKAKVDLLILLSDNESWVDARSFTGKAGYYEKQATRLMQEWQTLKKRNPAARMVCLDMVPNTHTQAQERDDILNIGGFSDAVFSLLSEFRRGTLGQSHYAGDKLGASYWVNQIEEIPLDNIEMVE